MLLARVGLAVVDHDAPAECDIENKADRAVNKENLSMQ